MPDIDQMVLEANKEFEELCAKRHQMGAQEYGPLAFMENDVLAMAMEEVADLANYARYTYIKLYVLKQQIGDLPTVGFIPTGGVSGRSSADST